VDAALEALSEEAGDGGLAGGLDAGDDDVCGSGARPPLNREVSKTISSPLAEFSRL
jgi:hypothetical protein